MPRAILVLSASIFCLGTSEFMVAGLLPDLASDLGVSIPSAGLLLSGFALGMIVGAPATALATRHVPPRRALVALLVVFSLGHFASALSPGYDALLAARIVSAVAAGAFWGVAAAVAVTLVDVPERARAIATLMGGLTVANVAGVPLGTLVGEQLGWRATFWIIAVLSALAAVAVLTLVPARRPEQGDLRSEVAVLRGGAIWHAYGTIALFQGAVFGAFSYLAVLMTHVADLPGGVVPVVLALNGLGACVGIALGGRLADAHPLANPLVSMAASAGLFALLAVVAGVPVAALVVVAVAAVASFSAAPALTNRVFAAAGRPSTLASALATSAFNVGNMIGPWLGGLAIGAGLGYRAPSILAAAGLASAALLVGRVWLRERGGASPLRLVAGARPRVAAGGRGAGGQAMPRDSPC